MACSTGLAARTKEVIDLAIVFRDFQGKKLSK
jgi:hypothetical protein